MNKILEVVLTGATASGKTVRLPRIVEKLGEQGFNALAIPEVATYLIGEQGFSNPAVRELTLQEIYQFQRQIIISQLAMERERIAELIGEEGGGVLVKDRGLLDGLAFGFAADGEVLEAFGSHVEFLIGVGLREKVQGYKRVVDWIRTSYLSDDGLKEKMHLGEFCVQSPEVSMLRQGLIGLDDLVFFYPSLAVTNRQFYDKISQSERKLRPLEEAMELHERLLSLWREHSHFTLLSQRADIEQGVEFTVERIKGEFRKDFEGRGNCFFSPRRI